MIYYCLKLRWGVAKFKVVTDSVAQQGRSGNSILTLFLSFTIHFCKTLCVCPAPEFCPKTTKVCVKISYFKALSLYFIVLR